MSLLNRFRSLLKPAPQKIGRNPWQEKQDAFMHRCLHDSRVKIRGVIHVGGHLGEEYPLYKQAGAKTVAFLEPVPHIFRELEVLFGKHPDVVLIPKAAGAQNETREMHVNRGSGESSSFMTPTPLYDGHFEAERMVLNVVTLDSLMPTLAQSSDFNVLVTDTQGFDMEVLKGATATLKQIDYVYTEVSQGHYVNEPQLDEFDAFLAPFGFSRAAFEMYGTWKGKDAWGDVFYTKSGLVL